MKTLCLAVGAMLAATISAEARCDWSGNCYSTYGGSTYGYNARTGSSWSSGSYGSSTYGTNSRGNSWNYNSSTGTYNNYGTGATRQYYPSRRY